MNILRRIAYMGLGALLVLTLILGGVAAFAQDGEEAEAPAVPEGDDANSELPTAPFYHVRGQRGDWDDGELLADALGISVEELQAAQEAAHAAAIEQALAEGLITEDQAEQLAERGLGRGFGPGLGVDKAELLADALGISVEELEAAQAEVRAARLAAMVEAGVLTQEEADLIAAREAVQGYVDQDGLADMVQEAYEAAVAQALGDGAITEAQADQLLESLPTFNFRFDGFGRGPGGGRGHHGGRHHGTSGLFAPSLDSVAPELEAPADA